FAELDDVAAGVVTGGALLERRALVWAGLVGLADAEREGVAALFPQLERAGVHAVMLTGDQGRTARAVAQRLNLTNGAPAEMIEFDRIRDIDARALGRMVASATIFARVTPSDKLRIVQALQQRGRIVAMTGDGINDGPALRAADVAIGMGPSGTEVARGVADIV